MGDAYEATIEDRTKSFTDAIWRASRVSVHVPNALGEWDVETFSPEVVKRLFGMLRGCVHCDGEFCANIEGENLCRHHAEQWSVGEGLAAQDFARKETSE